MQIWKKPSSTAPQVKTDRRRFLRYSGAAIATGALLMTGCDDDDIPIIGDDAVDLGSGDVGILNYAYALEQLEAAFYARVLQGAYYNGASAEERLILSDLEKHERAHAEFFQVVINSVATPIPALEFDFTAIDFDDRDSVLSTASAFEDLGVGAYNGAGRLLTNPDYLTVAGKIVSVEGRHAAAIRDIFGNTNTAFAGDDIIDANGLDLAIAPDDVLATAGQFIVTIIDASNLPR